MKAFLGTHELINLEEELRSTQQPLYVRKNSTEGLNTALKSMSLRTGWACYLWQDGVGLQNLKSTEPPAPDTKEFKAALNFALARKHFSVFVFPINDKKGWLEAKLYFTQNKPSLTGVTKFMFILSREASHRFFKDHCRQVVLNTGLDGNYVLRDGQWVSVNDI